MAIEDVKVAIQNITERKDFSLAAAEALEAIILQSFRNDPRFEELLDILPSGSFRAQRERR